MAGDAMAEAFDEIGTAIPDLGFRRVWLERAGLVEQRIPSRHQRAKVERKRERILRRLRAYRGLRHEISIERLHVGVGSPRKMGIRKRRIEQPPVAMNSL